MTDRNVTKQERKCILDIYKNKNKKPPKFIPIDEKKQIYQFDGWGGKGANVNWLKKNESRLICVLSVSLVKKIGDTDNFNRMDILKGCIKNWVDNGQSVLIFIPVKNLPEYKSCFLELNKEFKSKVKIVAYNVTPHTCGNNMVVGESRNAILDFVRKYKDIFHTCVISDERIFGATFGINRVLELKEKINPVEIDKLREKYGYAVFNMVRDFIAVKPSDREPLRKDFQKLSDQFDRDVKKLKITKKYLNEAPICITQKLEKGMEILGQYEQGEYRGKLVKKSKGQWLVNWDDGERSEIGENFIRPARFKPNLFDSLRNRNSLTLVGFSSSRRSPFHVDYSDEHLKEGKRRETEVIAQIAMFRVNRKYKYDENEYDYGWHGQQDYTKTTMCEDNVWSYDWDETDSLGDVGELDSLAFQRRRGLSLTRTTKETNTMSKCALEELVEACMSNSYVVTERDVVKVRWTESWSGVSLNAQGIPDGRPSPYYFMACLLRDLYDACITKQISWATDDEKASDAKKKIKRIRDSLKTSKTLNPPASRKRGGKKRGGKVQLKF